MLRSFYSLSRQVRTYEPSSFFQGIRHLHKKSNQQRRRSPKPKNESWFPILRVGTRLGLNNRYRILKLLESNVEYSFYLGLDERENRRVTIRAVKNGPSELWAHECLSSRPPAIGSVSNHCHLVHDHFTHFEQNQPGNYLCLVKDYMSGDVAGIMKSWPRLPFSLVKRILLHVLRGIAHIHSCGVVHTDLNLSNIVSDATGLRNRDNDVKYLDDYMNATYFIGDFSHAQHISDLGKANESANKDYRPPETILKGPWNEKVDIWAFGCLIFNLAVSEKIFRCEYHIPRHCKNANERHLWQMQSITGENFGVKQLKASINTPLYFNRRRRLKSHNLLWREKFTHCLDCYKLLKTEDVDLTAALMERCLHLDPDDRATAEELLKDPFWDYMT